ncbi:unnamed protein product [marine sediment metagenome]|uniref:Uncharacterized protein n=1 Tax=marine sediment metagenome TaxID=412755 RepID=X0SZK4_9ZZZZ
MPEYRFQNFMFALLLIDLVEHSHRGVSVNDVAEKLEMEVRTAYRLMEAAERSGLYEFVPGDEGDRQGRGRVARRMKKVCRFSASDAEKGKSGSGSGAGSTTKGSASSVGTRREPTRSARQR